MKSEDINIDYETEALGPRKVGRFLMSGKLELNVTEEDLEELKENKIDLKKKNNLFTCNVT